MKNRRRRQDSEMVKTAVRKYGNEFDEMALFKDCVTRSVRDILEALESLTGRISMKDPNFSDTPDRVARAYVEAFEGMFDDGQKVRAILKRKFPFPEKNSEMIVVGPVHVWSICAHHLLPVEMDVWLGYLPKKYILGLSKLARLAEQLAKKPGLQEGVTSEIADALYGELKSKGAGCLIRGRHLCMSMRGVKKDAITTTTQLRGFFLKPEIRQEFLSAVHTDVSNGKV